MTNDLNKIIVTLKPYKDGERYLHLGDICFVPQILLSMNKDGMETALFDIDDCTEEFIMEMTGYGIVNTAKLFPPKVGSIIEMILFGTLKDLPCDMEIESFVTNEKLTNGAVAIFYPGVADQIYECFGEDYYIIFTSKHEAMLHPVSLFSVDELRNILSLTIERAVKEENILSYNIFKYSEGRITMC